MYPDYASFLEDGNERIYDLEDIVNNGYFLHPKFKGSWSIKDVLPAMIPELSYEEMSIKKGDQASIPGSFLGGWLERESGIIQRIHSIDCRIIGRQSSPHSIDYDNNHSEN